MYTTILYSSTVFSTFLCIKIQGQAKCSINRSFWFYTFRLGVNNYCESGSDRKPNMSLYLSVHILQIVSIGFLNISDYASRTQYSSRSKCCIQSVLHCAFWQRLTLSWQTVGTLHNLMYIKVVSIFAQTKARADAGNVSQWSGTITYVSRFQYRIYHRRRSVLWSFPMVPNGWKVKEKYLNLETTKCSKNNANYTKRIYLYIRTTFKQINIPRQIVLLPTGPSCIWAILCILCHWFTK